MAQETFIPCRCLLLLLLLPPASEPSAGPGGAPPPPPTTPHCSLRSLAVPVRALGLGYLSDETVVFRYCGGDCPEPRPSNHRLALAKLRGAAGGLVGSPEEEEMAGGRSGGCCRPTRYEDVAFLDEGHHWHRLRQLSAAACRCLG